MRILMLSVHTGIKSPITKITPLLVNALRAQGVTLEVSGWGRRTEREPLAAKFYGRVRDVVEVSRRLRDENFDVLTVNTAHDWSTLSRDIPLLLAARRHCGCTVLQFHGSQPNTLNYMRRPIFSACSAILVRLCDAALVLSSEEKNQWRAFYDRDKFHVVDNPFIPEQIDVPGASDRKTSDVPTLLFVGRLIAEKGVLDLVSAVNLLKDDLAFRLVIAGEGPAKETLSALISKLDLTDRIELAGHLSGDNLSQAYARADILALPTYWIEGFPTVLSEAMSAGLPIITTKIRGAADHLQEGKHALFVPAKDPESLAKSIKRLIADADLRQTMSKNNKELIKAFAPEIVAKRYLDILAGTFKGVT